MSLPVEFNSNVASDLRRIIDHYENRSGKDLADEFFAELTELLEKVRENPQHFPYYHHEIRRANFRRFPYHFLYEIRLHSIWIFVLRHHRRNPTYGSRRK